MAPQVYSVRSGLGCVVSRCLVLSTLNKLTGRSRAGMFKVLSSIHHYLIKRNLRL
jgi:hypothetical protein